jgi:hypothetical protein
VDGVQHRPHARVRERAAGVGEAEGEKGPANARGGGGLGGVRGRVSRDARVREKRATRGADGGEDELDRGGGDRGVRVEVRRAAGVDVGGREKP